MSDTTTDGFTRDTLTAIARGPANGALARLRDEAYEAFEALPMPSPDTEEWRYTDLRDLDLAAYTPYAPEPRAANLDGVSPGVLAAAGTLGERAGLAIQHNSSLVTAHLDPEAVAAGVIFASIDDVAADRPDLVEGRLHGAVPALRTRFTALHGAFRTGGTFVSVPKDVRIELPLQAITYVDRDGLAVFPHTVIVLEEGAELTFIDRYVSPDLTDVLSDAVVEIYVGPNATLRYVSLQDWGSGVTHVQVQRAEVERDAELRSLAVAFGASLSRMEAESHMTGDGGSSEMLGVYVGHGDQHFDFRSIQDHVGSRTVSDLLYKGALKGASRAIYSGTVILRPGAHLCDAYQTNRNILLSEDAKADSIPNLEILSNDPVRCGHAASVGPVEEETLFYLQSRGIPLDEAEKLVVFGFFQEVLDRVTIPEVKRSLEAAIAAEIAAPELIERSQMPELREVTRASEVPEGEARRFVVDGHEIAVVNLGTDGFRAVDDICSHERYHLSDGEVDVDDATIECPKHGSTFSLETGRPRSLPATHPVAVYPVTVEGDLILIDVDEKKD